MKKKTSTTTVLRGRRGFTIVEMLVALVVVSIAGTITVQLFTMSYDLALTNADRSVGAELAHEQLSRILEQPGAFQWPNIENLEPGQLGEINPPEDGDRVFSSPSTRPKVQNTALRQDDFYLRYQWDAYCSVPSADSAYVEVTVVTRWLREQDRKSITLTSAIDRDAIPQGAAK